MNSIEQKRQALISAYPGASWKNKVVKMSDDQVIAVYFRLVNQKKI